MSLTKTHFATIAVTLTIILFIPFFLYLPIEVANHRPGNFWLLAFNAGILAVTVALLVIRKGKMVCIGDVEEVCNIYQQGESEH